MKDKKIRILCLIAAVLSLLAVVPVMFEFFELYTSDIYGIHFSYNKYGFELYTDKTQWWFILLGVLGIVSLLWNLVYGAYSVIDGRYRNLTWRIARYGYFYGIVVGILNFAATISLFINYVALPAAWIFFVLIAAVVAVEIVLIILKDEDTKSKYLKD